MYRATGSDLCIFCGLHQKADTQSFRSARWAADHLCATCPRQTHLASAICEGTCKSSSFQLQQDTNYWVGMSHTQCEHARNECTTACAYVKQMAFVPMNHSCELHTYMVNACMQHMVKLQVISVRTRIRHRKACTGRHMQNVELVHNNILHQGESNMHRATQHEQTHIAVYCTKHDVQS